MSRLKDLNVALVTVLFRYHEIVVPPEKPYEKALESRVNDLLDAPLSEMLASLQSLIEACHTPKHKRVPLLHYLLYHILSVRLFLTPVEIAATAVVTEAQPSPSDGAKELSIEEQQQQEIDKLYKQLISGEKILSLDQIQQQLIELIVNIQTLLLPETKTHSFNYSGINVITNGFANGWTSYSTSLCTSGTLLDEELFLPLGLRPKSSSTKVTEQISNILTECREVSILTATNVRLGEQVSTLTATNLRLAGELGRVVETNRELTKELASLHTNKVITKEPKADIPPKSDTRLPAASSHKYNKKSLFDSGITTFASAVTSFLFEDDARPRRTNTSSS